LESRRKYFCGRPDKTIGFESVRGAAAVAPQGPRRGAVGPQTRTAARGGAGRRSVLIRARKRVATLSREGEGDAAGADR